VSFVAGLHRKTDFVHILRVANIGPTEDLSHGHDQNPEIEPKAAVIHIPDIKRKALPKWHDVTAIDGGPTRDSRACVVTTALFGGVGLEILEEERTRSNETHLPFQHVPELRQFVDARRSEQCADPGQSCLVSSILILAWAKLAHRSEFENRERLAMESGPALAE
jgi:hypothetical protein